jgi:hypothetical protein
LRAALKAAGWSLDTAARQLTAVAREHGVIVHTGKGTVGHWVTGTVPTGPAPEYLAEALCRRLHRPVTAADLGLASGGVTSPDDVVGLEMTGDPVAAVARLAEADSGRRGFLAGAVYSVAALALPLAYRQEVGARVRKVAGGGLVGGADVAAVRTMTTAFVSADEVHGGGHARPAAVAYLTTDVAELLGGRFASERVRREMYGAGAELAYMIGFKTHDSGSDPLAQRYYLQGLRLAVESDPGAHAAYFLRILAHQALDLGQHQHCVNLASAALDRAHGRVDSGTLSLFLTTLAMAYAASGDHARAARYLNRAESAVCANPDQAPAWAAAGGSATARHGSNAGKTLLEMRSHVAAERLLRTGVQGWDPITHPRVRGLGLANLGHAQLGQGRIEEACSTWSETLDLVAGVRSARTVDAARKMIGELATVRGRGVPGVAEHDQRARGYIAGRAL